MPCPKCKATLIVNGDIATCPACNSKYRVKKKVNPAEPPKAAVTSAMPSPDLGNFFCPGCGGSIFKEGDHYICKDCNRTLILDQNDNLQSIMCPSCGNDSFSKEGNFYICGCCKYKVTLDAIIGKNVGKRSDAFSVNSVAVPSAEHQSVQTSNLSAKICTSCGSSSFEEEENKYICAFCRCEYTVDNTPPPAFAMDMRMADNLRQNSDFAGAKALYQRIINENAGLDLGSAYWGLFLCENQVFFEVDGRGECFPSFYRVSKQSVEQNPNYINALSYARKRRDGSEAKLHSLGERIEYARRQYWVIAENNKPYDIFICFRNDKGESRQLATDLYNEFSAKYNVFFSERTLRVINGNCREYEPNIYYGLYTAKIMLLICKTRASLDGADSKWVKNEWSRFNAINGKSGDKVIIPIFMNGFDPHDLPDELWHIQGVEQGITLVATLEKQFKERLGAKGITESIDSNFIVDGKLLTSFLSGKSRSRTAEEGKTTEKLLVKARYLVEDGKFEEAEQICNQIDDPTCAEKWWLLFLISQRARTQENITEKNRYAERALENANEEQRIKYSKALANAERRQAAKTEDARRAEALKRAEEARRAEVTRRAEEARRAEAFRRAEAVKAEEARKAEAFRRAETAKAEEARKAEEKRIAEASRRAEETKLTEASRRAQRPSKLGKKVFFGSYPQTMVTDGSTITALNALAGAQPTAENSGAWISYGYYKNSTNTESYMWYLDREYKGNRYRGVYFTDYRPYFTRYNSSADYSYQDNNGYSICTTYWFRYEPIKWDIIEEGGGYATIVSTLILDSQNYYEQASKGTFRIRTDYQGNTAKVYDNNYQYSAIRSWLNESFYNTAFTVFQQSLIQAVTIDNSAFGTKDGSNKFVCDNTTDKVWLLSYKEAFGIYFINRDTRMHQSTDYAKVQGLYVSAKVSSVGNSYWRLRSPSSNFSVGADVVINNGDYSSNYVHDSNGGVLPVMKISLK